VRQALVAIPRKNGKSQLAAALALAHLCGPEAVSRGQVYSAAADRNQAAIIMREMVALIMGNEHLAARCNVRTFTKEIEDTVTGSLYAALSCDARKAHGLSPTFVVCDEVAQWRGRELYENLVTGCGAHAEPLLVVISTMSPDPAHLMSELVRYGEQVRTGHLETTPGKAIDKGFVVHRLGEIASEYKVEAVAYDRWGMAEFQRLMADEDLKLPMVEFGQGFKDMAPALSPIEKLVLNRELRHPDHPILNWCVANAVAVSDPAANRKLAKDLIIAVRREKEVITFTGCITACIPVSSPLAKHVDVIDIPDDMELQCSSSDRLHPIRRDSEQFIKVRLATGHKKSSEGIASWRAVSRRSGKIANHGFDEHFRDGRRRFSRVLCLHADARGIKNQSSSVR
jgi:phage terminase large subunit-like protein